MENNKKVIGVYGIQDTTPESYPLNVHDHSLVLFFEGKIKKFIQIERLSGIKYDKSLPLDFLKWLQEIHLLAVKPDFDMIFVDNIVGRSFISADGKVRFEAPLSYSLYNNCEEGVMWWFDHKEPAYVLNHELAHVYSALPFFGPFKENSLMIHFDGGASQSNASVWVFNNGQVHLCDYHWELKYLSSLFNANALVFQVLNADIKDQNAVPGKAMGLAAYGRYDQKLENWLNKYAFFRDYWGRKKDIIALARQDLDVDLHAISDDQPLMQDIMATIQYIFTRDFLCFIRKWQKQTGCRFLYFSGGAALNIKLNRAILDSQLFEDLFIPPCTNDAGLAIGAGACLQMQKGYQIELHSPYLNNAGLEDLPVQYDMAIIEEIARLLIHQKIIGVANGYGECGPRALGNRSLLALPVPEMARKVSMQHKKREWYRPVAPVMLASEFKARKGIIPHHLTKYMLLEYSFSKVQAKGMEGCIHVDGTARVQCIFERQQNPFVFDLLTYMNEVYRVPALINTSFNQKGMPMVHTPEDAFKQGGDMGLDALVINGQLHLLSQGYT